MTDRGFTLIEVLAALAVLSIALGALLPLFAGGLRAVTTVEDQLSATLAAKSLLAEVGRTGELSAGTFSGDGWTLRSEPVEAGLWRIELTVTQGSARLGFVTLRAGGTP